MNRPPLNDRIGRAAAALTKFARAAFRDRGMEIRRGERGRALQSLKGQRLSPSW
jgi:hypothetical protein